MSSRENMVEESIRSGDANFLVLQQNLLLQHPLMTGSVLLPTPQIADLCSTVYRAVITRQLGLCFTAKSGMGKTCAMKYLSTFLRAKISNLVVFNHICRNHKGASVRGFFKHFLNTVGHLELNGETADLRRRLVNRLIDDARLSGIPIAMFLIDEAQAMDLGDFQFLKDTANELNDNGIVLMTVLMAQEPDFTFV